MRLARGAFWSLLGSVLSRVINLGGTILVARLLGQESFGAIGIIQGTVGLFATMAGFGLGTAVTKYVAEYRRGAPVRAGRLMTLALGVSCATGGAVSLLLWMFSTTLATSVLAAPHLAHELRISGFLLLLGSINGVQVGALSGLEAFRLVAAVNVVAGLAGTPLQLAGASLGGLPGAIWGLVAASFVNVIIAQVALVRSSRRAGLALSWKGCTAEARLLGGFAIPLLAISLATSGASWLCNAILVNQRHGYAEMALLNASSSWLGLIVFVAASMQQGIFPALTESLAIRNVAASKNMLKTVLLVSVAAATPFTIASLAASPWIMRLYGSGFANGWPVLAITVVMAWVSCLHTALNQFILAAGRMAWFCLCNGLWSVCVVGLAYIFVAKGAQGQALARAIAFAVVVVVESALVSLHLRAMAVTT